MLEEKAMSERSTTVLVVDDNARFRELIRDYLPGQMVVVGECVNGDEALRECRGLHPGWVLMDIEMKDCDGLMATRNIHREFPGTHVVVVSHHDEPEMRERARAAGAEHFVSKSELFRVHDLLAGKAFDGPASDNLTPRRTP